MELEHKLQKQASDTAVIVESFRLPPKTKGKQSKGSRFCKCRDCKNSGKSK
nr:MAG TPA: hypothetical protein [Caudoviricetes sp.]